MQSGPDYNRVKYVLYTVVTFNVSNSIKLKVIGCDGMISMWPDVLA